MTTDAPPMTEPAEITQAGDVLSPVIQSDRDAARWCLIWAADSIERRFAREIGEGKHDDHASVQSVAFAREIGEGKHDDHASVQSVAFARIASTTALAAERDAARTVLLATGEAASTHLKRANAAEAENERLREALRVIADGEEPRPIGERWRRDNKPSKLDRCTHDVSMFEDCGACVSAYAAAALAKGSSHGG